MIAAPHRARSWFSLRDAAGEAEAFIYDAIGTGGIAAQEFIAGLKALGPKPVRLRINSPGGDVFDGLAIYNALRTHPGKVTVSIEGMAASIASVIAMAGKTVRAAGNSFMMLHDPHALCLGTAEDMRRMANLLVKVKAPLVAAYSRSGADDQTITAWMAAETWFTAEEAWDAQLVDHVDARIEASARFDLSRFKHPPAALATSPVTAAWDRAIARLPKSENGGVPRRPGPAGGAAALLTRPAISLTRR